MTKMLRVSKPGLFTTIQDLGRPQVIASGVPPGGAMDRFAHAAANLIVGNDRGAATLECTLTGSTLLAEGACVVAITGGDLDPRVNGAPVEMWTAVHLVSGDLLTFGGRRLGARAYIAVAGGIMGDRWLGSLSTYVLAGRAGMHGRALVAGDVIEIGPPPGEPVGGRSIVAPRYDDHTLKVIDGPHADRLTPSAREALFGSPFQVSAQSDRMGFRLDGPALETSSGDVLSFGLVAGVVQLPPGGNPILLMADHQTAGGYPVVATVISASMPVAAQLAPGDELRFEMTTIEAALEARAAQRAALDLSTS